jgi:hypothetical protein
MQEQKRRSEQHDQSIVILEERLPDMHQQERDYGGDPVKLQL